MFIILLTVIIEGAQMPAEQKGTIHGSLFIEWGIFQAIGVISFGKSGIRSDYNCMANHGLSFRLPYVPRVDWLKVDTNMCTDHNSLLIYGSLRKPTIDRFATLTHYSTGVSMLACLAMALAGFLTFGDIVQGNVLNNFPTNNLMVNLARL